MFFIESEIYRVQSLRAGTLPVQCSSIRARHCAVLFVCPVVCLTLLRTRVPQCMLVQCASPMRTRPNVVNVIISLFSTKLTS